MIGGGFLGGGISIVPAGKAIIYASMTTEDGANIPNAVFKATRTGSTVTVNGSIDGRAELLVDAGHTYTVTVTPAGGSYLNNSQTVATASAKSYAVKFYLYPSKANESSTTASLNALNTSISSHSSNKSNPHGVTKAQVGLGNVNNTTDMAKPVSTAQKAALDGKAEKESTVAHIENTSNPHAVTKAQVGLGSVNNTSDSAKPISTATQTALNTKAPTSHATSATTYGVGSTTNYGHVKVDSVLSTTSVNTVQNKAVKAELDTKALNTDLTSHATSKANPHGVTKAQVGLSNVNNTSDSAKPISTATQDALNGKVSKSGYEEISGVKMFHDPFTQKVIYPIGILDYPQRKVNQLLDVNGDEFFAHIIAREGDGRTILKTDIHNTDGARLFKVVLDYMLYDNGTYGEAITTPNGVVLTHKMINADGTGYSVTPMRSSPSSNDAVNVKYVLDRVSELVGYVKLYQHSVRVFGTGSKTFSVALTIINTSSDPINSNGALHAYLGTQVNAYYPCSGMFWSDDKTTGVIATEIRGNSSTSFRFRGMNMSSGDPTFLRDINWTSEEVNVTDWVRGIL